MEIGGLATLFIKLVKFAHNMPGLHLWNKALLQGPFTESEGGKRVRELTTVTGLP